MTVEIEVAQEADDDAVAAFNRLLPQLSTASPILDGPTLSRMISHPASTVLFARVHGEIVGTLTLVMFPGPSGVRARIEDVVVDGAVRGQGVGTALAREALRLASAAQARTVDLTSRPSRSAANRLYERLGFQPRDTRAYRYTVDHSVRSR
ncbi:MAG: hypothetical protein QOI74_1160 [Micromonosporaceae bacterium]|jgi:ribosomal protein S18 acetylase RimI-like enzyme|nr:hypothetical protein [Micromonosporaceae bacterium]MDT5035754.1 hypothetical protein [Micromonosporaceae bacterium]